MPVRTLPTKVVLEHLSPAERFLYEVNCVFRRWAREPKSPVVIFLNLLRGFFADGCSLLMLNTKEIGLNGSLGGNAEILNWMLKEVAKSGLQLQEEFCFTGCLPEERMMLICRGLDYSEIEGHDIRPVLIIWRKQGMFDAHDLLILDAAINILKTRISSFPPQSGQLIGDSLDFGTGSARTREKDCCKMSATIKEALDCVHDYVLIGDRQGNLLWLNRTITEVSNQLLPEDEHRGFSWLPHVIHLEDVDGVAQKISKVIQSHDSAEFPARMLVGDASSRRLDCRVSVLDADRWIFAGRPEECASRSIDAEKTYTEKLIQEMRIPVAFSLANMVALREEVPTKHLREQVDAIHGSILQVNSNLIDALLITDRSDDLFPPEIASFSPEGILDNLLKGKATIIDKLSIDVLISMGKTLPKMITADKWKYRQICERLISHILGHIHPGTIIVGSLRKILDSKGVNVELQAVFVQATPSPVVGNGYQGRLDFAILKKLVSMVHGSLSEREDHPTKQVALKIILPFKETPTAQSELMPVRSRAKIVDDLDKFIKSLGKGSQIKVALHGLARPFVDHICDLLGEVGGLKIHCTHVDEASPPRSVEPRTIVVATILNDSVASWLDSQGDLDKSNTRIIALRSSPEVCTPGMKEIPFNILPSPYTDHNFLRALQEAVIRLSIALPRRDEIHTSFPPASPSLESNLAEKCPMSVMVAEDNLLNLQILVKTLNKLGYTNVVTASDGQQAVERFCEQDQKGCPVGIIFMDMQMPVLDGCGASLEIRQLTQSLTKGRTHGPHIVAMTANSFQEDRQSCLRSGMCRFASKPVNLEFLVQLLREGYEALQGTRLCRCQSPSTSSW